MIDEERYAIYETTAFLDATTQDPDLSVYKWKEKLRSTCWEANKAVQLQSSEPGRQLMHDVEHSDVNSVYLPGPDRWVTYDNRLDVIHLRLRADPMSGMESPGDIESGNINSAGEGSEPMPSRSPESMCGVSRLLDCLWSKEMATTVRLARHIAFDVSDVWDDSTAGPVFLEEAPFLACIIQHGLEVLYLIHKGSPLGGQPLAHIKRLQQKCCELERDLHGSSDTELARAPDSIRGVGKVYREVFNLGELGWHAEHPTYIFARAVDEAVRSQQAGCAQGGIFQGVRVLVVCDA